MTLTFQGQVTSWVTWPFDSPYAISYWRSIGTKPLSLMVFENSAAKPMRVHTQTHTHTSIWYNT